MVSGLDAASAETYIELTLERIDEMMVIDRVKDSAAGAVSSFFGTTRDNFQGMLRVPRLNLDTESGT